MEKKFADPAGEAPGRRIIRNAGVVVNVVAVFATAVLVGVIGGVLLDRWLNTAPAFTLVLSSLGTAAGIYTLFRELRRVWK